MPQGAWAGRSAPAYRKAGWRKWAAPGAPGFWSPGGGSDPGASHRQPQSPPGFGWGELCGTQSHERLTCQPCLPLGFTHHTPAPHHAPVPSGTPGCRPGAGSRESVAQTPRRPPGSLPPGPVGEEAGPQEGHLLRQIPSSPPSSTYTLPQFPFGLSIPSSPPWDNLLQRLHCLHS